MALNGVLAVIVVAASTIVFVLATAAVRLFRGHWDVLVAGDTVTVGSWSVSLAAAREVVFDIGGGTLTSVAIASGEQDARPRVVGTAPLLGNEAFHRLAAVLLDRTPAAQVRFRHAGARSRVLRAETVLTSPLAKLRGGAAGRCRYPFAPLLRWVTVVGLAGLVVLSVAGGVRWLARVPHAAWHGPWLLVAILITPYFSWLVWSTVRRTLGGDRDINITADGLLLGPKRVTWDDIEHVRAFAWRGRPVALDLVLRPSDGASDLPARIWFPLTLVQGRRELLAVLRARLDIDRFTDVTWHDAMERGDARP